MQAFISKTVGEDLKVNFLEITIGSLLTWFILHEAKINNSDHTISETLKYKKLEPNPRDVISMHEAMIKLSSFLWIIIKDTILSRYVRNREIFHLQRQIAKFPGFRGIYISQLKIANFLLNRGIPRNFPFFEMFCIVLANQTKFYRIRPYVTKVDQMLLNQITCYKMKLYFIKIRPNVTYPWTSVLTIIPN